jgi:hypothetical protein
MSTCHEPAAAGVLLLGRIDDAEDGAAAGKAQPEVASSPDVARKDFDGDGFVTGAPRELGEAGEFGGDHVLTVVPGSPPRVIPSATRDLSSIRERFLVASLLGMTGGG